jgi:23S rRNA (pseudouridine1915-N3)-methyltransferase
LEIKEERASKGLLPRDIIDREGERILRAIPTNTYLVALVSGGESCASERLAERFSDLMLRGNSKITFIIGGAFGLSEKITDLADLRLSLSAMTFPHEFARVILLEQIYRAFTIIRGESYHK